MKKLALYIHWPFCKSKCPYCDFNSHVSNEINHVSWQNAYLKELNNFYDKLKGRQISSIFFGGGTPSLMQPEIVKNIIIKANDLWGLEKNAEITLEANPTSIEAAKLKDFKSAGINRLSMGIQALKTEDLKFLGREHSVNEAIKAIETAAEIFENYSFDLIYARPEQTPDSWKTELEQAIKLSCKHLSLYQLTIEKGTPFYSQFNKGEFSIPDENNAAALYEMTQKICEKNNLPTYEISNHAEAGFESKHNLAYWNYQEYLGIGPGAHSRLDNGNFSRQAVIMVHDPAKWLKLVETTGKAELSSEIISDEKLYQEILMMGLRLKTGIDKKRFKEISGKEFHEVFAENKCDKLKSENLLEADDLNIKTTPKGAMVLNSIINYLGL